MAQGYDAVPVIIVTPDATQNGTLQPASNANPIPIGGTVSGGGGGGSTAPTAYGDPASADTLSVTSTTPPMQVAASNAMRLLTVMSNESDTDIEILSALNNTPGHGFTLPAFPQPLATPSIAVAGPPASGQFSGASNPFVAGTLGVLANGSTPVYRCIAVNEYGMTPPSAEFTASALDAQGVCIVKANPVPGARKYLWVGRVASTGSIFAESDGPVLIDTGRLDVSIPRQQVHLTPWAAVPTVNSTRPRTTRSEQPQYAFPGTQAWFAYHTVTGQTKKLYVATYNGS